MAAVGGGDVVARCGAALRETIVPLLRGERRVALVDFPHSLNCGDHAIWLGEKALLGSLGIEVVYACDTFNYDREAMAERIGDGLILMQGGGNFGDLYRLYNEFRLRVLEDFPNNRVVVFPVQAAFLDQAYLNRVKAVMSRHGNLTIIVRDVVSHHMLSAQFAGIADVLLTPDMAFALGPQRRICPPNYDIVWLARTDGERMTANDPETVTGLADTPTSLIRGVGFPDGLTLTYQARQRPGEVLITDWYRLQMDDAVVAALNAMDYDAMSAAYLSRALLLLSLGRLVITDRLHAHILCMLLGVPHILLNNAIGKNWNFYESWTRGTPLCRLASGSAEAWAIARSTIKAMPQGVTLFDGWSQAPTKVEAGEYPWPTAR
jgi:exopolysaccharide biosynthesis predicted pyruvyltransferase EpsI